MEGKKEKGEYSLSTTQLIIWNRGKGGGEGRRHRALTRPSSHPGEKGGEEKDPTGRLSPRDRDEKKAGGMEGLPITSQGGGRKEEAGKEDFLHFIFTSNSRIERGERRRRNEIGRRVLIRVSNKKGKGGKTGSL